MDDQSNPETQVDDSSLSAFGFSFLTNLGIAFGLFMVFCFFRTTDRNIYEPKTYMMASEKQPPPPPKTLFGWIIPTWSVSDEVLLRYAGLDAFMFLKFLRTAMYLFAGFTLVTVPLLFPLNITDQPEVKGLKKLVMGAPAGQHHIAHLTCLVLLSGAVVYLLHQSMLEYADLRQDCLLEPEHSVSAKARTLLVASIPKELNNRKSLFGLFNVFPGGVKHITINRSVRRLAAMVKERDALHYKLEQVMTKWISLNIKARTKSPSPGAMVQPPRVMHRTGMFGLYGKKVDSIDFYLANLLDLNRKINQLREANSGMEAQESAFIMFNTQIGAHVAAQALISNQVLYMNPKYIETDPAEVLWDNLDFSPYELIIRRLIGTLVGMGMGLLWFIPIGFISGLSKLDQLEVKYEWIKRFTPESQVLRGLIQGYLPPVLIVILTSMVPIIFTFLSTFQGLPRAGDVQLSVMTKYFWFLMFTVLLASTLGSSLSDLLKNLQAATTLSKIFELLSKSLPPASSIFINMVLLKALTASSKELLQIVNLIKRRLMVRLFVSSPRKNLEVIEMSTVEWGTLWPEHTLIFAIGMVYAVLAPFSNIFIALYFFMFYTVYRYQMLFVFQTERNQAQGMFFIKAVTQIFVGTYISQITFAGVILGYQEFTLFGIAVATLVATAIAHSFLLSRYSSVVEFIPIQKAIAKQQEVREHLFPSMPNPPPPAHHPDEIPLTKMPDPSDFIQPSPVSTGFPEPCPSTPFHTVSKAERARLENFFTHPALVNPQPVIWIPQDEGGFANTERDMVLRKAAQLIEITTHGSTIDWEGRIQLSQFSFPEEDSNELPS